jgi:hypothetical protein
MKSWAVTLGLVRLARRLGLLVLLGVHGFLMSIRTLLALRAERAGQGAQR